MAYNRDLYENVNLKNATTVVVRVPLLGVKQKPHKPLLIFGYSQNLCSGDKAQNL